MLLTWVVKSHKEGLFFNAEHQVITSDVTFEYQGLSGSHWRDLTGNVSSRIDKTIRREP